MGYPSGGRQWVRRGRRVARLPRALALAILAAGCGDVESPDEIEAVWTVDVEPDTATLRVGESRALLARARGRDGSVLLGRTATWRASDTSVALVDSAGKVTARRAGEATVVARIGGREGSAAIRVQAESPAAVARIEIEPGGQVSIRSGSARQLAVRLFSEEGTELFGRAVSWSSSDPLVARVDAGHVLKGAQMGSATLTATAEGRSAVLEVEVLSQVVRLDLQPTWWVLAPGEMGKLNAYPRDEAGNLLNKAVAWHSSDPAVATVAGAGRVTGIGAGVATLTASTEGVSAQLRLVVGSWTERQLLRMEPDTASGILFRISHPDSVGTGTTVWYQARSGRLRLLDAGAGHGRYEMRFDVAVLRDGYPTDFGELVLPGTFGNDAAGRLEFRTVNDEPLSVVRLGDGRLAVTGTGRTTIGGQEVSSGMTFVYAGE